MSVISDYLKGLSICLKGLSQQDIAEVAEMLFQAYKQGKQIVIMGNGGSASTASHFARDLKIGTAVEEKPRVRAMSITDNMAMITSLANDVNYNAIFEEQLVGQLDKGDIIIGISASGNSPNVLNAIAYARESGATTVALTGFGGGKIKDMVDKAIIVSSWDYGQVEDVHLCLCHILAYAVKEKIVGDKSTSIAVE